MAKLIAKTYGDALFEIAVEKKMVDNLLDEAREVLKLFEENQELAKLLGHPDIEQGEKLKVVENVFQGRVSDEMVGLLRIIVDKGRYHYIEDILHYFISLVKEYKKIGIAYVSSAIPLTEEQELQIQNKLLKTTQYREFEMHYQVDPSLIGGLIIRIGDRVVDGSIKSKINNLRKDLTKIQLA